MVSIIAYYIQDLNLRGITSSLHFLPSSAVGITIYPPSPVLVSTCRYAGYNRDRFKTNMKENPNAVDAATPCHRIRLSILFVAARIILFRCLVLVLVLMLMVPFWQGIVQGKKLRQISCLFCCCVVVSMFFALMSRGLVTFLFGLAGAAASLLHMSQLCVGFRAARFK